MITYKTMFKTTFFLLMSIITLMFKNAKKRNVVRHKLNARSLKMCNARLKVFFISDIHRRKIDAKLLRKIDKDVDIVIIGGDLAERGVPFTRILMNIRDLSTLAPVFYVWGNNDREAGEQAIRAIISGNGGVILDNDNVSIPGHPTWGISGTDDPTTENVDIRASLRNINRYNHVIFVSHQPRVLREIEYFYRPTLMLAGHTHGGQIRIGRLGLLEKGKYQSKYGRGKLISNGYGTSTVPLRLGAPAECHIITINY